MVHIVNPHNLDIDDDAVFSGALSQGLIWLEDDDNNDENHKRYKPEIEYLATSGALKIQTLNGQGNGINDIATYGDFVISTSSDRKVCVWNWKTGEKIHTLTDHRGVVNGIVVSGDFVISASSDKTACVWNWKTGEKLRTLTDFTAPILNLDADGDVVALAVSNEVWLYNWKTGEFFQKLMGCHSREILSVSIEGDLALSVSPDLLLVRNWKTSEKKQELKADHGLSYNLNYLNVNKCCVIFRRQNIEVWNWKTGRYLEKSDLSNPKNDHIYTKAFLISSDIWVYSCKKSKWCLYSIIGAEGRIALLDDHSHIITSGRRGGWMYVVRINASLSKVLNDNAKYTLQSIEKKISKPIAKNQMAAKSTNSNVQKTASDSQNAKLDYTPNDILQEAHRFVRERRENWVNFSRVSQHLYQIFHELKPQDLGQSDKKYKNLQSFFAAFPSDFELRQDPEKQGLFWIRLRKK